MIIVDEAERQYIFTVTYIHIISLLLALIFFYLVIAKAEKGEIKKTFLSLHSLIIIWLFGKILKTVSPTLLLRWSSNVFYYIGILPLGPAYLFFSRAILGKKDSYKLKICLYIPPIIFFIFLLTNPLHYNFYKHYDFYTDSFGSIFYIQWALTYVYIILSIVTLFRVVISNKQNKVQALSLALGALLPLVSNLNYVFRTFHPMFDITPIIYNLSIIILGISAFNYNLFNFIPKPVSSALNILPGVISIDNKTYGKERIEEGKSYKKSSYSINVGKNELLINKAINTQMVTKNTKKLQFNLLQMKESHNKIKQEVKRRIDLLQQQECLRLAGEVHDILGYSITSIICLLETCRYTSLSKEGCIAKLEESITITNTSIYELTKCISNDRNTHWEQEFYTLVSKIENHGFEIELIITEKTRLGEDQFSIFYKILKESITNSIRYSSANKITIAIQQMKDLVLFNVIDDGSGCTVIQPGTGLLNMERRIKEASGSINFYSEPNLGFQISVQLPISHRSNTL